MKQPNKPHEIAETAILEQEQLEPAVVEDTAREIHKEYLICPNFDTLCTEIGCNKTTMYRLFDEYGLPRKNPAISEALEERWEQSKSQEQLEPAIVEDEPSTFLKIHVDKGVTRERLDKVMYGLYQSGLYNLEIKKCTKYCR